MVTVGEKMTYEWRGRLTGAVADVGPVPDGHDLLLQPGRTPLEDDEELLRELLEELGGDRRVDVREPLLLLVRQRDLPVGPLARQVDAEAGDHRRFVLQAHCGQMQTGTDFYSKCLAMRVFVEVPSTSHEVGGLR